eukprot:g22312.t1
MHRANLAKFKTLDRDPKDLQPAQGLRVARVHFTICIQDLNEQQMEQVDLHLVEHLDETLSQVDISEMVTPFVETTIPAEVQKQVRFALDESRQGKSSSSKGKNAPKDFTKVKNKVGKKKKEKSNEMKTDYKVKKVQMPAQHALEEKGEEVTHRKLSLSDLRLGLEFRRIALCATDGSPDVRAANRSFQGFLLEAMPGEALAAFGSKLALQVRGALSHVSEASRLIGTLCKLHKHVELVLPCLLQLSSHTAPALAGSTPDLQVSLQDVLDGKLQQELCEDGRRLAELTDLRDGRGDVGLLLACVDASGAFAAGCCKGEDRPEQARFGPPKGGSCTGAELETQLMLVQGLFVWSFSFGAAPPVASSWAASRPPHRYPIIVEDGSPYRPLADAINLRLAHVLALLAAGRGPSDAAPKHLERLAWAALEGAASGALPGEDVAAAAAAALRHQESAMEPTEVKPFSPTAGLCHALRVLDLLWCCAGTADDTFIGHLAGVTGALANGTGVPDKELCPTAASLLSVPLTASLLGLQPLPPPGLPVPSDHATSSALQRVENLDRMAEAWVTSWPKMLWYLGSSYPEFSSFLMSMILQLAKRARPHSLCANLLAAVLPLLVPFIAGARESAPPLARLPLAQPLAAAMVFHFPRLSYYCGGGLSMRLIQAITSALGRWSSARRTEGDALSDDCCQLLLEAILEDHGRPIDAGELLVPRLQAALALLQMPTESPQGEVSAVKLANVVAAWLMETVARWGHGSSSEGPWPGRPEALDLSKPGVATVPAGVPSRAAFACIMLLLPLRPKAFKLQNPGAS